MSYIFGKLWHSAIIWPIRKSFQCILQGVRILLAKQTRLSGTSGNESCIQFQFLIFHIFHCRITATIECFVSDTLVVYLNWNLNISLQHNNNNNNCTIESPVWYSFAEIWLNSQSRLCKHLDCCCEELLLVQIHAERLSHFHHKTIVHALFIVQLWHFYRFMQEIV